MGCSNSKSLTPVDLINLMNEPDFIESLFEEHKQILKTGVSPIRDLYTHAGPEDRPLFEHSRVIVPGEEESTIINASYIQGFERRRAYIATETPQSAKGAQALWETVWQHRTNIVVMLNKPEGGERGYCYWSPGIETSLQFRKLKISTVGIETFLPTLEITKLELTDEKGDSLTVYHFLYFNWQDQDDLPPTYDFLKFLFMVREYSKKVLPFKGCHKKPNPILVHCSDGLERTMVYCAIDISISEYLKTKTVNIFSTVLGLRNERFNCLSDRSCYVFCYDTLYDYFLNGSAALY